MKSTSTAQAEGCIVGFIVGATIAFLIAAPFKGLTKPEKELINHVESLVELCEAQLPRDKHCELKAEVVE